MAGRYNLKNIRTLLIEGFTHEELRRLCYDVSDFRPVYDQLTRNTGKAEIIDQLLEYAERKVLIEQLLTLANKLNPARYAAHEPYSNLSLSSTSHSITRNELSSPSISNRPYIVNPHKITLPPKSEFILKQMFAGYRRVIIEKEFGGGFSGGRVLLLRPIRQEDRPELPAVVKIASVSLIAKERQAYRDFIQDRLPNAMGLRDTPFLPGESEWDALRYPLMGSGTFAFQSLRDYCRTASLEDIRFVLENRLLKAIESLLQFNRVRASFSLQASHDPLLPLNLLVQPGPVPAGTTPVLLTPQALPGLSLKKGDYVRLEGFVVTKVDLVDGTVTLNVPLGPDDPPASYSLRLKSVGRLASYQADQIIEPIEGMVLETRQERLEAEARRVLGAGFHPAQEQLTLPDGTGLPNPLLMLPHLLSQMPHVRVGTIHGDLNMENVLVDPVIREINLIDFAATREDHVLHDFLRLETEVVTKLIPELLAQANLGAGIICSFYEQLHRYMLQPTPSTPPELPHPSLVKPLTLLAIIRTAARRYFFNPDDWTEYYQGLVLYLLGALKFANLDSMAEAPVPLPKQVAFWGAAMVGKLLTTPVNLSYPVNISYSARVERNILSESRYVRELIFTIFNDEELTTFCYDHFREVRRKIERGMTFHQKVQLLIEYCESNDLLNQLLILIRETYPTQFSRFASFLQSETWDDYIQAKLIKQNYVCLPELELVPEKNRQKVFKSFLSNTTRNLIYNSDKTCLMYRFWPKLKALTDAWETLADYLMSDIDNFVAQWINFAQILEDALGVDSSFITQSASRYNRIVGYKINVGSAFEGLNLPGKLLLCTAQFSQPTLAEIEGVYHLVRNQYHASIALLVLFSDSDHAQQIQLKLDKNFKRSQACDIIVLTYAEISSWLKTDSPLDEVRRTVLKQVNLKAVSPFVINGPTPENMFFGRENELRRIRDHLPHQSFAITGGRRIGKTSIAQRLHTDYLPAANFYALYQDISFISNPEQFFAIRLDNWEPTRPAQVPATIGDLLAVAPLDRPVALLLDEADKLVPFDRKLGWPIFNQLRAAANTGYLRVILIGGHQLRESMQDSQSPLFNFTNNILIGRLNFENVEKLVTQPLERLEIIYDPRIVRRIYEFTSGHPNIVQRLCQRLIEILDIRNDRKLGLEDVEEVVNAPGFQRDDFLNTYLSQATVLEHILTIMLAKAGQISNLAAMRQVLRQELGLEPSARELSPALRRLVDLRSILNHTSQGYTFAVPAIPLVINQSGASAIADLLEQYVEDYRTHGDKTLEEIDAMEWA